jgi:hypothetical protein
VRRQVAKRLAALRLHQPLLGASMPQARKRPSAGGVNRLEERLWPSSPAKRLCAAHRRFGHACPDQLLGVSDQQINPRMLKNNRFSTNVNWCFSTTFLIACTVPSAYLQTEFGGRISQRGESRLKNYSGLTLYE